MLGENIYRLRKLKNLSQEQLAELIHVSRQTISNWELGETSPNPEQLKLLSKVLQVSVDELLNNDVKSILVEKVSNTERLAGIIIKILKGIGIVFIILFIIDIACFILFNFLHTTTTTHPNTQVSLHCQNEDTSYLIMADTDGNYDCISCPDKIRKDIQLLIDDTDLDLFVTEVNRYFQDIQGFCE